MRTPYHEDWNKYYPRQGENANKHWRVLCVRWGLLSSDDHTLLGIVREKVIPRASAYLEDQLINYPTEHCTNKKHDTKVLIECLNYFQLRFSSAYDILRWSREYCWDSGNRKSYRQREFVVCHYCNDRIDSALNFVRTRIWDVTTKTSESLYAPSLALMTY